MTCKKYSGSCTIDELFCARRHARAIEPGSSGEIDYELCVGGEVGIEAHRLHGHLLAPKPAKVKREIGHPNKGRHARSDKK